MECSLFRTAMISSSVESCGRKQLSMARVSEKRTPWRNQNVKEAIRAKKDAFKTLLQNRSSSDLQFRYSDARKIAAQAVKNIQRTLLGGICRIPSANQQTKYFGRPFADCVGKV